MLDHTFRNIPSGSHLHLLRLLVLLIQGLSDLSVPVYLAQLRNRQMFQKLFCFSGIELS